MPRPKGIDHQIIIDEDKQRKDLETLNEIREEMPSVLGKKYVQTRAILEMFLHIEGADLKKLSMDSLLKLEWRNLDKIDWVLKVDRRTKGKKLEIYRLGKSSRYLADWINECLETTQYMFPGSKGKPLQAGGFCQRIQKVLTKTNIHVDGGIITFLTECARIPYSQMVKCTQCKEKIPATNIVCPFCNALTEQEEENRLLKHKEDIENKAGAFDYFIKHLGFLSEGIMSLSFYSDLLKWSLTTTRLLLKDRVSYPWAHEDAMYLQYILSNSPLMDELYDLIELSWNDVHSLVTNPRPMEFPKGRLDQMIRLSIGINHYAKSMIALSERSENYTYTLQPVVESDQASPDLLEKAFELHSILSDAGLKDAKDEWQKKTEKKLRKLKLIE